MTPKEKHRTMDYKIKILQIGAWVLAFEIIGGLIGATTAAQIEGWYNNLDRAPLTPPDYAFAIVWPLLYAMIAIAGWRLWQKRDEQRGPLLLFAIQMVMNWAWSFIFFTAHAPLAAFIWMIVLIGVAGAVAVLSWPRNRPVTYLFIPYLLWLCFAAYLNGYIAVMN